jgi:hypothetical protein
MEGLSRDCPVSRLTRRSVLSEAHTIPFDCGAQLERSRGAFVEGPTATRNWRVGCCRFDRVIHFVRTRYATGRSRTTKLDVELAADGYLIWLGFASRLFRNFFLGIVGLGWWQSPNEGDEDVAHPLDVHYVRAVAVAVGEYQNDGPQYFWQGVPAYTAGAVISGTGIVIARQLLRTSATPDVVGSDE